jgi:general secretion pathway protein M
VKTAVKAYLGNLNDRERWTLGLGVFVCVAYLFYLMVYSPLAKTVHNSSLELLEKQETLVWMQQVQQQYKGKARKTLQVLSSSNLLTVLADKLNEASFKRFPYQLQQTGVSDIQLMFDQVPYNTFISWLWSFNEKYKVSVKQLNIERTDTPGVVKLMMVIAT